MREIKFRGKTRTTEGEKWVYGYLYKVKSFFDEEENCYIRNEHITDFIVDKDTVGQYTGLKDKNGVEIYEGDIVSEKGHYVNSNKLVYQKIQWKENYSCWLRGEYQRLTPKNIKIYDIEVVGNIYDNPELIEKEGK